ncbi:hypothetical protein [Clostridium sp.]|nr:hypothetical protein [Clostridium sp.]
MKDKLIKNRFIIYKFKLDRNKSKDEYKHRVILFHKRGDILDN